MKILISTLLLFSLSSLVHAVECENVLALSKTTSKVVEDKSSFDSHASNFCSEYASSKSSGRSKSYGLSYKFLSASMGSDNVSAETVASKYCDAEDTKKTRDSAYRQYIETIAPRAYSAYEQCIKMAKQDLKFSLDMASLLPNEFSLAVSYASKEVGADAEIQFSPSQGVDCNWLGGSEIKTVLESGSSALLDCSRADKSKRGYVKVIRTDAGDPQIMSIPWAAYDETDTPIDALKHLQGQYDLAQKTSQETNTKLQEAIARLEKTDRRLNNIGDRRCSWGAWMSKAPLNISATCPNGEYLKGVGFKHAEHAEWWREEIRVQCCGF